MGQSVSYDNQGFSSAIIRPTPTPPSTPTFPTASESSQSHFLYQNVTNVISSHDSLRDSADWREKVCAFQLVFPSVSYQSAETILLSHHGHLTRAIQFFLTKQPENIAEIEENTANFNPGSVPIRRHCAENENENSGEGGSAPATIMCARRENSVLFHSAGNERERGIFAARQTTHRRVSEPDAITYGFNVVPNPARISTNNESNNVAAVRNSSFSSSLIDAGMNGSQTEIPRSPNAEPNIVIVNDHFAQSAAVSVFHANAAVRPEDTALQHSEESQSGRNDEDDSSSTANTTAAALAHSLFNHHHQSSSSQHHPGHFHNNNGVTRSPSATSSSSSSSFLIYVGPGYLPSLPVAEHAIETDENDNGYSNRGGADDELHRLYDGYLTMIRQSS